MSAHRLQSDSGTEFEIVVDERNLIADVVGDWPGPGGEFTLEGPLPEHSNVTDAPDHIQSYAKERSLDVCFYDPRGCRTCYCDASGRRLYCVGMC